MDRFLRELREALDPNRRAEGWSLPACLFLEREPGAAGPLLDRIEREVRAAGGQAAGGGWREGLERPYGGLLGAVEELALALPANQAEVLLRYGSTLVTLLPGLRRIAILEGTRELRAGLPGFALRGDRAVLNEFYQRRHFGTLVVADLVHFIVDAALALAARSAEGRGLVLVRLEGVERALPIELEALSLLRRYALAAPVLLCAAASAELPAPAAAELEAAGWRRVGLATRETDESASELSPALRETLDAAAVLGRAFPARTVASLLPEPLRDEVSVRLERLRGLGLLRQPAADRFVVADGQARAAVDRALSPERRRALHAAALQTEEAEDPFVAAWHAVAAGLEGETHELSLRCMERAWSASAYDLALVHAERCVATAPAGSGLEHELLLGLLHYEAERYDEADRWLSAALARRGEEEGAALLLRLVAYNAIFGLKDYERGIELMEEVLRRHEGGSERDTSYIRNSLAFAMHRSGRVGDAIEQEKAAIDMLRGSQNQDQFLVSLLHLNLGRLYRNLGLADHALVLIEGGLAANRSRLSPYILLLFHISLGHVHLARGDAAAALSSYHHCYQLVRDLEIEAVRGQALQLFAHLAGPLSKAKLTRADEVLCYLCFNLAALCRRVGFPLGEELYRGGIESYRAQLGEEAWSRLAAKLGEQPAAEPGGRSAPAGEDFAAAAELELARYAGLVCAAEGDGGVVRAVVDELCAGGTVVIVRPRGTGPAASVVDSLSLYSLADRSRAARVKGEMGGSHLKAARAAMMLPEALDCFDRGLSLRPLIFQEATLRQPHRATYPGLVPVRMRVQVLHPEVDELLHAVLRAFAARSGELLIAAEPFHLRGFDLAASPEAALHAFLTSSADLLVLGDRPLRKPHGPAADSNILPFRPRLSENAFLIDHPQLVDQAEVGAGHYLVRVRSAGGYTADSVLRLKSGTRPILDLCDGSRSVSEIVRGLQGGTQPRENVAAQVCGFLRRLQREQVIWFDLPDRGSARGPEEAIAV